jgi:hypothetical protein
MQHNPSYDRSERDYPRDREANGYEVGRLRRWLFRLGGFLLPTVIVTGLLGGTVARLKAQQDDLAAQIRATQAFTPDQEEVQSLRNEISQLSQQIETLNQQVPQNLSSQLSEIQTRVTNLDSRISAVNSTASSAVTPEQLNQALQRLQQAQQPAAPNRPSPQ